MFLLNLSLAEFLVALSALSGVVVALYLLDRSRRRVVISSLRFWNVTEMPVETRRRRRIRQPWSLLVQLLSMLLLLLAIAQLRWGSRDAPGRNHVLLLDTSSWAAAAGPGGSLLAEEKRQALRWVSALPAGDRVLLVRADGAATPVTAFESNLDIIRKQILASQPGASALDLELALRYARRALQLNGKGSGEIVYAGAGRIRSASEPKAADLARGVHWLPVRDEAENTGIRKVGLRRLPDDPETWEVYVSLLHTGRTRQTATVLLTFAGSPAGTRRLTLDPGVEQSVTFQHRAVTAGWMEVRLLENDALPRDNRVRLETPALEAMRVAVYSARPDLLRPLFAGNRRVDASFFAPSAYRPDVDADLVVLDGFAPPVPPRHGSLWLEPPLNGTPFTVKAVVKNAALERWNGEHPVGAGLRTRDVKLEQASVFRPAAGDVPVADVAQGPVILARPESRDNPFKSVAVGFQPLATSMRYDLATPLLFANILHWVSPEAFQLYELNVAPAGQAELDLGRKVDASGVRIFAGNGRPLPFDLDGQTLRFFTARPDTVRIQAGGQSYVYSQTLPELPDRVWDPPASVQRGIPVYRAAAGGSRDLWQMLALLGALGLLLDWMLYGRRPGVLPQRSSGDPLAAITRLLPRWARPNQRRSRRAAPAPIRRVS